MVNKLPTELTIDMADVISDKARETLADNVVNHLSNEYGYCIESLEIGLLIRVKNIKWDTSE